MTTRSPTGPLDDDALVRLQDLLQDAPAGLEPLDLSALDGYLCGVLLQPKPVAAPQWLAHVFDMEGRPAPAGAWRDELAALAQRRHAELARAIAARDWFDPWLEAIEADTPLREAVLPWVAGFAIAMDHFPALMALEDSALVEPLALLYLHFDADDLEDADRLLEAIDEIEPPGDLADAAQDLVRAVLLMADVTQPRAPAPRPSSSPRRRAPSGGPRRR
jgi:uncharacterized protein